MVEHKLKCQYRSWQFPDGLSWTWTANIYSGAFRSRLFSYFSMQASSIKQYLAYGQLIIYENKLEKIDLRWVSSIFGRRIIVRRLFFTVTRQSRACKAPSNSPENFHARDLNETRSHFRMPVNMLWALPVFFVLYAILVRLLSNFVNFLP